LAVELIDAGCGKYNSGYFDSFTAEQTGMTGVGFILMLLKKYGAQKRLDVFYSDKYFQAFNELQEEGGGLHCFSMRMFDRRLRHLGLIEYEKEGLGYHDINGATYIKKSLLLDRIIICHPPRYILKTGKS
jgi:hypothetical protein